MSRSKKLVGAVALAGALLGCQKLDAPLAADLVAEDRWADVETQLDRRHALVASALAAARAAPDHDDEALARLAEARARANLRMTGEDLTDPLKVAAFVRADQALSLEIARLTARPDGAALHGLAAQLAESDAAVRTAEERYDVAGRAYDAALGASAPGAVNKLTGRRFKPRVRLGVAGPE